MAAKEAREAACVQRVDDEHVGGGGIAFHRGHDLAMGEGLDLLQGTGEPAGLTANLGTQTVGGIFACSRYGHLHDGGREWCEEHDQDGNDGAGALAIARAAEEEGELAEKADGTREGGGDGHEQGVAVFHMCQFMGHDTGEFVARQCAHDAGGGGHGRMGWAAAGGEGVGLVGIDHEDPRHGQLRPPGQGLDHTIELGRATGVDLACIVHAQHHVGRAPKGESVHGQGGGEGHGHAGLAGEHEAHGQEQGGHRREKQSRSEDAHVVSVIVAPTRDGAAQRWWVSASSSSAGSGVACARRLWRRRQGG